MVALGSWNGAVGHLAETGVNDEPMIMAIRNWQSMSTDLVHDGRISPLRGGNIGFGGNPSGTTQPLCVLDSSDDGSYTPIAFLRFLPETP